MAWPPHHLVISCLAVSFLLGAARGGDAPPGAPLTSSSASIKSLAGLFSDRPRGKAPPGRRYRPPASLYMSALYRALESVRGPDGITNLAGGNPDLVVRSQDPVDAGTGYVRFTVWPNDLDDVPFTTLELILIDTYHRPTANSRRHSHRPRKITVCLQSTNLCRKFPGQTRHIASVGVIWVTFNISAMLPAILRSTNEVRVYYRFGHRRKTSAQLVLSTVEDMDAVLRKAEETVTLRSDDVDRKRRYAPPLPSKAETDTHLCHPYELYVSVKDLGWEDLVIQPQIISTGFCQGVCPEPLIDNTVNCTNNAYVRSVYRTRQPVDNPVPAASCVPISFNSGQILYHGQNGSVIIRMVKELEVKSCGCM